MRLPSSIQPEHWRRLRAGFSAGMALLLSAARLDGIAPEALADIGFEQRLGTHLTETLPFQDENAREVQLGDYLGGKPLIVVLGYYECPMLCNLVLNGLVECLQDLKWSIGEEFNVVTVSINPKETPLLAAAKKRTYLKRYGRASADRGWHFLTGAEPAIRSLTQQIGFHYAWDAASGQYAHASGFVIVTPGGEVARYFFGISHSPRELSNALRSAGANQVAPPVQSMLLLCFHYNPITGKYSLRVLALVRLLGAATVVLLAGGIVVMARRGGTPSKEGGAATHGGVPLP